MKWQKILWYHSQASPGDPGELWTITESPSSYAFVFHPRPVWHPYLFALSPRGSLLRLYQLTYVDMGWSHASALGAARRECVPPSMSVNVAWQAAQAPHLATYVHPASHAQLGQLISNLFPTDFSEAICVAIGVHDGQWGIRNLWRLQLTARLHAAPLLQPTLCAPPQQVSWPIWPILNMFIQFHMHTHTIHGYTAISTLDHKLYEGASRSCDVVLGFFLHGCVCSVVAVYGGASYCRYCRRPHADFLWCFFGRVVTVITLVPSSSLTRDALFGSAMFGGCGSELAEVPCSTRMLWCRWCRCQGNVVMKRWYVMIILWLVLWRCKFEGSCWVL